jgi:uncharacterized protein YqeY
LRAKLAMTENITMMRDTLSSALKEAMKAKDTRRLSTVRLIQSAIKDRDIANRGTGKAEASDDEILQILQKMVKQREEAPRSMRTPAARSWPRRSARKSRS